MKTSRNNLRLHRKRRIRAKIKGTEKRPRVSVFKSLKGISAQVVDDEKSTTIASAYSREIKQAGKNNIESAKKVGVLIANKCIEKKIKEVVFDRSGYKYHGKIKALADGVREGGLKF